MTEPRHAQTGCLLVGEYVDEAEVPANCATHRGEAVRPQAVESFLDVWGRDDGLREFTVLMKDGRVVAIRGHTLRHEPHPQGGQDVYSIVVRAGGEEVLVGLFKSQDVSGVFCGEVRADRRTA